MKYYILGCDMLGAENVFDMIQMALWNYTLHMTRSTGKMVENIVHRGASLHGKAHIVKANRGDLKAGRELANDKDGEILAQSIAVMQGTNMTTAANYVTEAIKHQRKKYLKKMSPFVLVVVLVGLVTKTVWMTLAAGTFSLSYTYFQNDAMLGVSSSMIFTLASWKLKLVMLLDIVCRVTRIRKDILYYKPMISALSILFALF